MPTYSMTGPDGKTYSIDGPPGATAQAVQQRLQQQFQASQTAASSPGQSAPAQANAAGQEAGAGEGGVMAAIGQAAHQGTFGLNDYINAGARYAAQRLAGVQNPDDYSTDVAYSRGKSQGEIKAHPIAGTIGGVLGGVLGGGAVLKAAKAIPGIAGLVEAAAPVRGAPLTNIAKAATGNAAIGGGLSVANGDDLPTAGRNAAISAVAGPLVQKGATVIADKALPIATAALGKLVPSFNPDKLSATALAAFQTLAKTLGVSGQDMQAAQDSHLKLTGAIASPAALSDLAAQGKLKALAAANPEIGEAAMTAASAGNAPLHVQLQQAAADKANVQSLGYAGRPQTSQGILSARDQAMDWMMAAPGPTGTPLRDEPVQDPTGLLGSAHIEYALRPNTQVNARLNQDSPVLDNITAGKPTIGDVEVIRKALRAQQANFMRASPNGGSATDPILAKEFGDMAQKVEGLGTSSATGHPDYGTALNGYRQLSRYNTGFEHGMAGKAITDAGDDFTAKDLTTPMGQAGYAHGNALNRAQSALDAISPNTVQQGQTAGIDTAAKVAHAAAAPSLGTAAAVMNHLTGLKLPTNVAKVAAQQLFSKDPIVIRQGIANIKRAGVSSKDIATLGAAIGGMASAESTKYLNGQ
jgi:hypothetical protein